MDVVEAPYRAQGDLEVDLASDVENPLIAAADAVEADLLVDQEGVEAGDVVVEATAVVEVEATTATDVGNCCRASSPKAELLVEQC